MLLAERVLMKAESSWAWCRVGDMIATKSVVSKDEGIGRVSSPGSEEPVWLVRMIHKFDTGYTPDLLP